MIPIIIKKLQTEALSVLLNTVSKTKTFGYFIDSCIEGITKNMINEKPSGNEQQDYYMWGYRKGLLDAHTLYKNLETLINEELKNRKDKNLSIDKQKQRSIK